MKFLAEINVMPMKALLDPQGKAVERSLVNLGLETIEDVRVGKHINLAVEAESREEAEAIVDKACKELLHNPVMETYTFKILD